LKQTVAEYTIDTAVGSGAGAVFGYIGARNISLVEAAYRSRARFVNVYHEQTAGFAACAYAQAGGKLGVAVSTSGPGATNMLTGMASAYCDSVPCLFITGQAATGALRNGLPIRNASVQEVDIVGMAGPVTKYAVQIRDAKDASYEIGKAIHLAMSGRPGPALIDLPEDIQRQDADAASARRYKPEPAKAEAPDYTDRLRDLVARSKRPAIIVGSGAHGFGREIAGLAGGAVPVVASMSAVDVFANGNPCYLGVAGNYGLRCANFALSNADLIIALGCTMTKRYTGSDPRLFAPEADLIRVDIDQAELDARTVKENELKICLDLGAFFETYGDTLRRLEPSPEWQGRARAWREHYYSENGDIYPYAVMHAMNRLRSDRDVVTADVGSHQIWAIQGLAFGEDQRFVSTSGLSTMGYGLPAAIGARYADTGADIVCVCGDGGLQMCVQELQLMAREKLPITVVVMDNGILGMIKTLQDSYYGGRRYASVTGYSSPDFVGIAEAYGIRAVRAGSLADFEKAFAGRDGEPLLIDVPISPEFDVAPRIVSRRPIYDLFPLLSDDELAANMLVGYERNP
jgi:acetolactate synthase-1/2/3 large subunit